MGWGRNTFWIIFETKWDGAEPNGTEPARCWPLGPITLLRATIHYSVTADPEFG